MCKESGKWNCEDVDPQRTQKKIEDLKRDRDALKAQKEELERKRSSLTDDNDKRENEQKIKEIDDKLYELRRTQEELEKEVSDSTKKVNDRMYVGKNCRDARQSVMEVFKDAKSRANGEHDADIEPLAKQLIEGWEKREPGHETAIEEVKKGIEKCDKVLYEIGHLGKLLGRSAGRKGRQALKNQKLVEQSVEQKRANAAQQSQRLPTATLTS